MMTFVLAPDEDVLRLICGHALQSVWSLDEKRSFYDELKGERGMRCVDYLVVLV